jgi:hypothetical protein
MRLLLVSLYRNCAALTFVKITGDVRITDTNHTSATALLQLLMVQRDLDFIGNTITINL